MEISESSYSPFSHLDPTAWRRSKVAHITLTVIGTLLLVPAAAVFFALWQILSYPGSLGSGGGEILIFGSALIGSVSGGLAWCALCLLFFKRTDLRWQRLAWKACEIFGYLTTPCVIAWFIWITSEDGPPEFHLILFLILSVAVFCAVLGKRYAILAARLIESEATSNVLGNAIGERHDRPGHES